MKVSILLATFNGEKFIKEQIDLRLERIGSVISVLKGVIKIFLKADAR